ncbi:MAG: transporter substrate-binding domain-containing protein [Tyzzerella sp.]|nr:transporter substrate-binding domain-containing protein [Tyzzerella sp.]
MKKLLSVLLVVALMLSMVACGGNAEDKDDVVTAKVIDVELTKEEYAFGVDKAQPELLKQVNDFIAEIMDNGKFDEICDHYFGDGEPVAVTSAKEDSAKDQLLVATNAEFAPFEYKEGDKYYGIDMEIAALLAEKLGKELVIVNMDFDAVCLSVGLHKADIAMAGLTVKEDRKEHVEFSSTYYNASQKIVVPSDNTEFDDCKDAKAVEDILNKKDDTCKIGVQSGTTGQFYTEGDADWDFEGYDVTTKGYKNGSLAIQDMLNGNIDYVIIDSAPAAAIAAAINEMR